MILTEQELELQIEQFIQTNKQAIVEDIAALVAVNSVETAPQANAPFGTGPKEVLNTALRIAERMGLQGNNFEDHMFWAELPGTEEGHLATITHLDVVPAGDGWNSDPFVLEEREGWILGRGVEDNKGPSVLCLYLLKFFSQLGVPLRYGLRVLLGLNEETGMLDVDHYLAHNEMPLFCVTPDAAFPVCNGEKGLFQGIFASKPLQGSLTAFSGGEAGNAIPARASCTLKADISACPPAPHISITQADTTHVKLEATGIGGHAASPSGTLNAIGLLVNYLLEHTLCSAEETEFLTLLQALHSATDGSALGIACSDHAFDPLTCVGSVITLEDGRLSQRIDIRFPTSTTGEALSHSLNEAAKKAGGAFVTLNSREPFYIPADAPDIQVLMDTYNQVFNTTAQPFTMGGGTYARHFTRGVSFGPAGPPSHVPDFVGKVHGANEAAFLDSLLITLKIYILSIWRLQKVDFD